MRSQAGTRAGRLPEIVPVLVYHGKRRWPGPLEFSELVEGEPRERAHVPRFRPLLVNLADLPDEHCIGSGRTVLGLLFLKYVRQHLTRGVAAALLEAMNSVLTDESARELLTSCYQLLLRVKTREEIELLQTLARAKRYDSLREDTMTYAEELLREGRREGRQEGRQEGRLAEKREVLVRQLSRRFRLSAEERARIASCSDPDALDGALDEVIVAETKAAVLARLESAARRPARRRGRTAQSG